MAVAKVPARRRHPKAGRVFLFVLLLRSARRKMPGQGLRPALLWEFPCRQESSPVEARGAQRSPPRECFTTSLGKSTWRRLLSLAHPRFPYPHATSPG